MNDQIQEGTCLELCMDVYDSLVFYEIGCYGIGNIFEHVTVI